MEKMDEALQQGNVMLATSDRHIATDGKPGIHPDQRQMLKTSLDDATKKDTDQKSAVQTLTDLTIRQDSKMDEGGALIQRIKEAAKGEYGDDDKARAKEFHIGSAVPKTVKGQATELNYMKAVAGAHKPELAKHGIKDTDIDALGTISNELSAIDDDQEAAKKVRKGATKARDSSMKELRKAIRKIQHSARSIFSDQPLILIEFESITGGRGPGGKSNPPPPPDEPKL